jgi:hypothetical protein
MTTKRAQKYSGTFSKCYETLGRSSISLYVCMYVCVCVYIYIYIYTNIPALTTLKIAFHFSSCIPSSPYWTECYSENESQCCPSIDSGYGRNQWLSSLHPIFRNKQVVTPLHWSYCTTHVWVYGPASTTARPSWLQNPQYITWETGYTTMFTGTKIIL